MHSINKKDLKDAKEALHKSAEKVSDLKHAHGLKVIELENANEQKKELLS